MTKRQNIFSHTDLDWGLLASLGVERAALEESGHLDALLRGERTGPLALRFDYHGQAIESAAMLSLAVDDRGTVMKVEAVGQVDTDSWDCPEY